MRERERGKRKRERERGKRKRMSIVKKWASDRYNREWERLSKSKSEQRRKVGRNKVGWA